MISGNQSALGHPKLRFSQHDRITIGGARYLDPEETAHGYLLRREDSGKVVVAFTHTELWEASKSRNWLHEPDYYDPDKVRVRQSSGVSSLHELAEKEAARVYYKWQVLTRFLKYEAAGETNRGERQLEAILEQIADDIYKCERARAVLAKDEAKTRNKRSSAEPKSKGGRKSPRVGTVIGRVEPPKIRTFRRWLAKFEAGGLVPWCLRDSYRNCGAGPRLSPKAREYVAKYGQRYLSRRKPSYASLHLDMQMAIAKYNTTVEKAERIACPGKDALRAYVRGLSRFAVCLAREGEEKAKRLFAIVSQGPDVVRPGQRVEMDHYEVDLMSLLKQDDLWNALNAEQQTRIGRMQFCAALDVATGCILGATLSKTASSRDARRVLRMVVADKTPLAKQAGAETPWDQACRPETVATDGGAAFIEQEFVSAILDLGAAHDVPPGGLPWLRGTLERFFETLHTKFISLFEGRTFGDYLRRGDYDSEGLAHLTSEELALLLVRWLVDVYHNTPSDSLAGETPRNAWLRLSEIVGIRPPPDRSTCRAVFGERLTRVLGNSGVKVLGLNYHSDALAKVFLDKGSTEIALRIDPLDLGKIAYRHGRTWNEATCASPDFDDVSIVTWAKTINDLKQTHATEALESAPIIYRAMDAIQQAHDASMARANISVQPATSQDIERLETGIFFGFSMPEKLAASRDVEESQDLLGRDFIVGARPSSRVADPEVTLPSFTSSENPQDDDFSFER